MRLATLIVICLVEVIFVRNAQIKFHGYPGYRAKEIKNTSEALQVTASRKCREGDCFNFCVIDELCAAFVYYKITQVCEINKYGRVLAETDYNASMWIKCMSTVPSTSHSSLSL